MSGEQVSRSVEGTLPDARVYHNITSYIVNFMVGLLCIETICNCVAN